MIRLLQRLMERIFRGVTTRTFSRTGLPEAISMDANTQAGMALRRAGASKPAVVVGIDFGTHSTKVAYRTRTEETAFVAEFACSRPGYPSFASPSELSEEGGRLWFGSEALDRATGEENQSLKLSLLSEKVPAGQAEVAAACYLGWVLGAVKGSLDLKFEQAKYFVNFAAPMDHLEAEPLKQRYLRVANAVWRSVFGPEPMSVIQGMDAEKGLGYFSRQLGADIPPEELRRFDVMSETVAPIVSMKKDSRAEEGTILIIDVGAGTTEISVNHLGDQIVCYFDQSIDVGAAKLAADPNQCRTLLDRLASEITRTWNNGYRKDAGNNAARARWRELKIILTGGGTLRPDVKALVKALPSNRELVHHEFPQNISIARHEPANISPNDPDKSFWAIAHGLTYQRNDVPIIYQPSAVEPLAAAAVAHKEDPFGYSAR